MGLGTFLSGAVHDVAHVGGDVGGFLNRDVARPIVGGLEKVPVLGTVVHDTGRALTNLAQWDRDAYTWSVSRPVATLGLMGTNVNSWGDFLSGSKWAKSWDESSYVSPGQALAANLDEVFGGTMATPLSIDMGTTGMNEQQVDKYYQNLFEDPSKVQAAFEQGGMAPKLLSGSYDAALSWYSDPGALAGHSVTGLREALHGTTQIKTTDQALQALNRPATRKFLDASDRLPAYKMKNLPTIARSATPDLLAGIFNNTVSRDLKEAALRHLLSDGNDDEALRLLQNTAEGAAQEAQAAKDAATLAQQSPFQISDAAASAQRTARATLQTKVAESMGMWGSRADQAAGILESIANAQQKFNPMVSLSHLEGMSGGVDGFEKYNEALQEAQDELQKKLNLPGTQQRLVDDILNMRGHINWMPGHFDVPLNTLKSAFSEGADKFGDLSKIAQHVPGGTTRPGQWVTQTLYKNIAQTPVKVLRAFGNMWPEGWIDYTNPNAGSTLENFLNRAKGMPQDLKENFLNQFYEAGSDVGKRASVVTAAEHAAAKLTLMSHGIEDADAEEILNGTKNLRDKKLAAAIARGKRPMTGSYSGAPFGAAGNTADQITVHAIDEEDGSAIHIPLLETMKRQGQPLLDLDNIDDWAKNNTGRFQSLKRTASAGAMVANNSAELFNSMWKNGVLLRFGFTPRVMTDMGLRALTTLGPATMLGVGKEVFRVVGHNRMIDLKDVTNRLLKNRLFDPDTLKTLNDKVGKIATARDSAQADLATAFMQKAANDQTVKAGLPALIGTPTDEEIATLQQRVKNADERFEKNRAQASKYQKTRFGDGALKIKGVNMTNIYGAENSAWLSQQVSSSRMIGKMFQRNADMEAGVSGSGAWSTIRANSQNELEAASHGKAWRHAVNNQILGDTLGRQVVVNNWSADDIVKWMKTSQGRAYLENIPDIHKISPEGYANRVAAHVHYTVPPEIAAEIRDKGLQGISQRRMEELLPNVADRPDVNGQLLNLNIGRTGGITNTLQHFQHAMHRWIGTMPLDTFVYHPTAAAYYKAHLTESIDKYMAANDLTEADHITLTPELQRRIENEAFLKAKHDVWSIMYDTTQQSTAAHKLRFIFPFLNAQQEILRHWAGIALDHPYIVSRQAQIWNSPIRAGLVYDSTTGDRADTNTPLANQVVRFQIPHIISGLPGLGVLNDLGQMQISKNSLNPILQGQNWYVPGAGPMVQIGVQALGRYNPSIFDNKMLNEIMPYGPGDDMTMAILPSWAQRLSTGFNVNNAQYASTFAKVYQAETIRYNEGLRTSAPSMQEIQDRTRKLLLIQGVASAVLPFSAKFNPGTQTGTQRPRASVTSGLETAKTPDLSSVPIQGLIDQYKKLESVDPAHAATNFYNKYGQALFALTMSTTKANASVPATAAGLAAISNPDIRAMIQADPSVAYAIVGPQAAQGPFDMAAYTAEMKTQIGGGNSQTFRQTMDPAEMVKEQKAQLGWQQYDQLMSIINSKMAERGITSLNKSSAQDLRTIKDRFLFNMNDPTSKEYNPDWYEQYTGAATDWNARIESLTALVSDPNLVNNPGRTDLKALGQYLEARQEINQYLDARPNKEGLPTTLADKNNADLAGMWDSFVSQLVMSNTNFALIYQHLLAGDPVNSNMKTNSQFQNYLSGVVGQ